MKTEVVMEADTIEDAMDAALEELGVQQDVVEYEVLQEPGRRLFGRSSDQSAKIRVWLKESFAAEIEDAQEDEQDVPAVDDEPDDTSDYASDDADDESDEEEGAASDEADEASGERAKWTDDEGEEITDERLDEVADAGIGAIEGILSFLGVEASVEEYEGDDGEIILDIVGPDLGILIGRHGKTLDALQTIVTTLARRELGWYYPILVDVEGYRSRRRGKLEGIARNAADKAVRQDREVRLRPMNSYERKMVHIALRDDKRVSTESEGDEPNRAVVVAPE